MTERQHPKRVVQRFQKLQCKPSIVNSCGGSAPSALFFYPMKFLLDNWLLFALAAASGAMIFVPALRGRSQAAGISPSAAVTLINREKAQVVDICDKAEYDAGHLPQAKHIPLADLEAKLASTVKNKNNPLVLVCASGVRSAKAQAIAQKLGYEKAFSLQGGVAAWKAANYPVEKSA